MFVRSPTQHRTRPKLLVASVCGVDIERREGNFTKPEQARVEKVEYGCEFDVFYGSGVEEYDR